jgi:hypothetical protein
MEESILDKYCQDIFSFLLVYDKPIRFNEMDDKINKPWPRMTRPTLLEHLGHLRARKLIIKKRLGRQKVTYEVNYQKAQTFKPGPITRRVLVNTLENKKRFESFETDEQALLATIILTLGGLQQLKLDIENILNPKDSFEKTLQLLLTKRFYDLFRTWLLQKCTDSTEHARQTLNAIERNIDSLTKEFFVKIPKPS